MALLTTPTYRDILRDDLPKELKEDLPGASIKLQCIVPTKSSKGRQCERKIGKEHVDRIQELLNRPLTYLEGDKDKIYAELDQLVNRFVHAGNNHEEGGGKKVKEVVENYRKRIDQHLEAKKCEGTVIAVSELSPVPEESLEQSLVEEEPRPVTQPSCTEVTMAAKVEEMTYSALPTTHKPVIEDEEEVAAVDSSNEPHPLLQPKNDTHPRPLAQSPTPLPSKAPIQLSDSLNTFPSYPLLSIIINLLQQISVGFISLVQVRWGHVPVETTSGEVKNKVVVDLKFLLGLRMGIEFVLVLLVIVLCGLYYQAWSIVIFLGSYVFVSAVVLSLSRGNSVGSEVFV